MSEDKLDNDVRQVQVRKKGISSTTFIISLALVASLGFVAGTRNREIMAAVSPIFGVKTSVQGIDLSSVEDTYRHLKGNYDGELNEQALIDGASRGLVEASGDRYTVFMDKKESEQFEKEMTGEVSGIGAEIGVRSGEPTIIRVLDDAPAAQSGVLKSDMIIAVNDEPMKGVSPEDAAKKIRGDAGTSVRLVVKRGEEIKEFKITRAKVNDKSVRSRIENKVGVLIISRFDADTAELARTAAQGFKSQGVRGVILDLRDNGGGYLDAAQDVSSIWLNDKIVVAEKSDGKTTRTIKTARSPVLEGVRTTVLVNGGSASASEIVAGALQDHGAATLIGEKTFGKGTVQKLVPLSGGRQLKVTIARWYTPKGKNITEAGISPDSTIQLTSEDIDAGRDPQFDAAIRTFNQ